MKTCLVCLQPQPDTADTCSECGEASWGAATGAPHAATETVQTPLAEPAAHAPPEGEERASRRPGKR